MINIDKLLPVKNSAVPAVPVKKSGVSLVDKLLPKVSNPAPVQANQPVNNRGARVVTLQEFLGGGSYNQGKPNELIKTKRGDAGVDSVAGSEKHHIIPVEFGGDSTMDKNIMALPEDVHNKITGAENLISNNYKSGKISLPEARLKMMSLVQSELDKAKGMKQGVAANYLGAVKDTVVSPVKKLGSFLKKKVVEPIEKDLNRSLHATNPNAMRFEFGEGLSNETTVLPGPRISTEQAYERGDIVKPVKPGESPKVSQVAIAKAILQKEPSKTPTTAYNFLDKFKQGQEDQKIVDFDKNVQKYILTGKTPAEAVEMAKDKALRDESTNVVLGSVTGESGEIKNVVKAIANSTDVSVISGILRKTGIPKDIIPEIAKKLTTISKESEVVSVLDKINRTAKSTVVAPVKKEVSIGDFLRGKSSTQEKLDKAIKEKNDYAKVNKDYIAPDSLNYTPNVAGRNNARIDQMNTTMQKYSDLSDKVDSLQGKLDRENSKIEYNKGQGLRDQVDTYSLNTGEEINLPNAGKYSSAKVIKVSKNSYQVQYKDGSIGTEKKRLVNRFNDDKIKELLTKSEINDNVLLYGKKEKGSKLPKITKEEYQKAGQESPKIGGLFGKVNEKFVDIRGKKAADGFEVGNLLKDFRNPSKEVVHFVYTDKEGKVLGHTAFSNKVINAASIPKKEIIFKINERADKLGAENIYIAHNHPSGNEIPSQADKSITAQLKGRLGNRFKDSVILDHDKMTIISPVKSGPYLRLEEEVKSVNFKKLSKATGLSIYSEDAAKEAGVKYYKPNKNKIGILVIDTKNRPVGYKEVNFNLKSINQSLKQSIRENNGYSTLIFTENENARKILSHTDYFNGVTDVINVQKRESLFDKGVRLRADLLDEPGFGKKLDNQKNRIFDKGDIKSEYKRQINPQEYKFASAKSVARFLERHGDGLTDDGLARISKIGEELLAEEDSARATIAGYKGKREALNNGYGGEMENQYQSFKKLTRDVFGGKKKFLQQSSDMDSLKTMAARKKILPGKVDNILYSQDKTGDEVLEMFRERISHEVDNPDRPEYELALETIRGVNEESRIIKKERDAEFNAAYKKLQELGQKKELSSNQWNNSIIPTIKKKFGVKELKNATQKQLDDIYREALTFKKENPYLKKNQIKALQLLDPKLSAKDVFITQKQAYEKYGKVIPAAGRGDVTPPLLDFTSWQEPRSAKIFGQASLGRETMERNIEAIAGKDADKVKKFLVDPMRNNETARVNFVSKEKYDIQQVMKELKIKARSEDDKLIQIYGEGRMQSEKLSDSYDEILKKNGLKMGPLSDKKKFDTYYALLQMKLQNVPISAKQLQDVPEAILKKINTAVDEMKLAKFDIEEKGEDGLLEAVSGNHENIRDAAKYFLDKYEYYIERVNENRAKFGYAALKKRKDYFHHFREMNSFFEKTGLDGLFGEGSKSNLPTAIAGDTEFFRPGKPFSSVELRRKGDKTDFGAMVGIEDYINIVSKEMFHTDTLARARSLERYINTADKVIAEIKGKGVQLQQFKTNLQNFTNQIAFKQQGLDRVIENNIFARPLLVTLDWLSNRTSLNMIVGNISSALTNVIPFTQSLSTTGKRAALDGMKYTIFSHFGKNPFNSIEGIESNFLLKRFKGEGKFMGGVNILAPTKTEKVSEVLGWLFDTIDRFTSKSIVAGKFYDNVALGMGKEEAMKAADNYAIRVLADRSVGEKPNLLATKTLKFATAFQLEINNVFSFLAKDMPKMAAGDRKKLVSMLAQFTVYSWLLNAGYEKVTGRRPAIDPIEYFKQVVFPNKDDQRDFSERLIQSLADSAGQLPFSSSIFTGLNLIGVDEYKGVKFNQGRYPLASIKPNSLKPSELVKPIIYLNPFGGGGQAKKTYDGISSFFAGEVKSSFGKVSFDVEKNPWTFFQMSVFGKYSTKSGTKYINGINNISSATTADEKVAAKIKLLAEDEWKKMKKMPIENRPAYYAELKKKNPDLAAEVKSVGQDEEKGLDAHDRGVKALGVKTWGRATFIYNEMKVMEVDERKAYYAELRKKGVITGDSTKEGTVAWQIRQLFENKGEKP